jgi:hypothetical protein
MKGNMLMHKVFKDPGTKNERFDMLILVEDWGRCRIFMRIWVYPPRFWLGR